MKRCVRPVMAAAVVLLGLSPAMTPAAEGPQRIVSLNICTDQLLVQLAERDRIASVTFLAADPRYSTVTERVRGLPLNHGLAEEVVRLDPDLVLAGRHAAQPAVTLLRRLGYRVEEFALPASLDDVERQVMRAASLLGVDERGEALVARMRGALANAAIDPGRDRPSAAVYGGNGFTAGAGTLADLALEAAGYRNAATEAGIRGYGRLDLERLVAVDPDVVVLPETQDDAPSLARQLLYHPVFRHARERMKVVEVRAASWQCGGPQMANAITRLARLRP